MKRIKQHEKPKEDINHFFKKGVSKNRRLNNLKKIKNSLYDGNYINEEE